ncbi:MAG: radical SAM protein [Candidatus Helarchaeota archaeon]|nr:radical SAM protein [Candidatus Helarchaeota archaeon]
MKFVYGPVPSRRLGRSLGVDTIPPKTCNFSCVYCQLGRTTTFINERKDFFPREDILQEIQERIILIGIENIDYVTFVGDGEPTLCRSLGWLLKQVKAEFSIPVAVITNGAHLYSEDVREELCIPDVILPSLDAGFSETFKKVNRPHPSIQFKTMIDGMIKFRSIFSGQIWMEYMAVKGLNDTFDELQQIHKHLKKISPDRVYVNVPIRPPAEKWVKIPSQESLSRVREILTNVVEIFLPETGEFQVLSKNVSRLKDEILQIIKRHPMRFEQLIDLLRQKEIENPSEIISELEQAGLIKRIIYENKAFFISADVKLGKK